MFTFDKNAVLWFGKCNSTTSYKDFRKTLKHLHEAEIFYNFFFLLEKHLVTFFSIFAHISQRALTTAAVARCCTPFSGPICNINSKFLQTGCTLIWNCAVALREIEMMYLERRQICQKCSFFVDNRGLL